MKPIYKFDEIQSYFVSEDKLQELLNHCQVYALEIEKIAQQMRTNKINNSVERQAARDKLSGIYATLNKISSALYSFANNEKNKVLVNDLDDYLKNPWRASEDRELKSGEVKTSYKSIAFSSTISKAKAEKESYIYFRVANYLKSYIDSIEQLNMSLAGTSKQYNRAGSSMENSVKPIEDTDAEEA
jgi:hypothetical protein